MTTRRKMKESHLQIDPELQQFMDHTTLEEQIQYMKNLEKAKKNLSAESLSPRKSRSRTRRSLVTLEKSTASSNAKNNTAKKQEENKENLPPKSTSASKSPSKTSTTASSRKNLNTSLKSVKSFAKSVKTNLGNPKKRLRMVGLDESYFRLAPSV